MTQPASSYDFEVRRDDLGTSRFNELPPIAALTPATGEIICKVDCFALTANNITYGAVGEQLQYWEFFPAEDGWGRIPVWGFADIAHSAHPDFAVGERLYGYFPMSTQLVMQPARVSERVFLDGTPHRRELHSVYNQYLRCATDPGYDAADEDLQMLFRPLFTTSFLIDDFLHDSKYFGARRVVISSASAKTAFGAAYLLASRGDCEIVGLTSTGNRGFVEGLGCYSKVLDYSEVTELSTDVPTVYVDIAGSAALRSTLHHHLGEMLVFDSAIGYAHLGTQGAPEALPGAAPQFFFAPALVAKREQDWGKGALVQKVGARWSEFREHARQWIATVKGRGPEALQHAYRQTLAGTVQPDRGQILSP